MQVSPDSDVAAIAVTPDGKTAYVALDLNHEVVPIDTATLAIGAPIPVGPNPSVLAITRDGTTLYVLNSHNVG